MASTCLGPISDLTICRKEKQQIVQQESIMQHSRVKCWSKYVYINILGKEERAEVDDQLHAIFTTFGIFKEIETVERSNEIDDFRLQKVRFWS